jgi:hypothetical protein
VRGAATYSICMDSKDIIQLTLHNHNILYVPDFPVRLLCPRHTAENMGTEMDGSEIMVYYLSMGRHNLFPTIVALVYQ